MIQRWSVEQPEKGAWIVLWASFILFVILAVSVPLSVRAYLQNATLMEKGEVAFDLGIYPEVNTDKREVVEYAQRMHLDYRFVPLLKEPNRSWKDAAIGRFQSGDTIRTDNLRFTEYSDRKGKFVARMLYDHNDDPGENVNVAKEEGRKEAVIELTEQLHQRMGRDSK